MTHNKSIAVWLFICALAVFLMATIGAVTRLTESGLSIVEWKPVTGALPPLNAGDWQAEFDKYQSSPQYKKINKGMTLEEFKKIFFWEWLHRLWGRLIGIFYAVPLLFFWRRIAPEDRAKYLGVLGLGFLQGAMGWYMVKSGLIDQPAVSHYRLAAHLMLAFLIYGCLLRLAFDAGLPAEQDSGKLAPMRGMVTGAIALAALTMTWGAFTAGLDAGLLYNTFPTMDGHWIPPELAQHKPIWRAFFEEPAVVQFTHRLLAFLTFIKVWALYKKSRAFHPPRRLEQLFTAAAGIVTLQLCLGVATLLSHVDIHLATLHQMGAMLLLGILIWTLQAIPDIRMDKRKPKKKED